MKKLYKFTLSFSIAFLLIVSGFTSDMVMGKSGSPNAASTNAAQTVNNDIWVSAYFGAWNHYAPPGGNWGILPTEEIDWEAFTHLFYFSLTANEDGSLSPIQKYHTFSPDRINAIVTAAHKANKPVLFVIGGWGNYPGFSAAIKPAVRPTFINNLIQVLTEWGFDGIDLDMEPIGSDDVEDYKAFVTELHRRLQDIETPLLSRPLLAAATNWQPEMFADLQDKFDQINLMTYDYSGPWRGWVSWHNAPLSDGGEVFASTGRPLPSAAGEIEEFTRAGVKREKLGIGIDFYGYIWTGVSKPRQTWIERPQVRPNIPYYRIMQDYYKPEFYRWDDKAKVSYLSIETDTLKQFISYDDERTIEEKIKYARESGIGGTIIWELAGGHRYTLPEGQRDSLLQAVKKALNRTDPNSTANPQQPPRFQLSQNYPNPFKTSTTIEVTIPATQHVRLLVYDVLGRKISTLIDRELDPGQYNINYDGADMPSGVYIYHLNTKTYQESKKMTLIK